ncbi:MAG: 1-acyl-sn-glycerol-3-phosphate acyltransferase [Ruminococcaceae bacterium]|nr:1-acyl-sn-glycerol-3-phosphate acyltransferase [Oscillospiraceae bacterium]
MKKERRPLIIKLANLVMPLFYKLKYGLSIKGKENLPESGPAIICSSHVTAHDPIMIGCYSKRYIRYMAKDSLFKNKFIGAFLRHVGAFPVARGKGDMDSINEGMDYIKNGGVMCIFLEGTRSKDGVPGKPKSGVGLIAAQTKVPVIPIAIIGQNGRNPKNAKKSMLNIGKPIAFEELQVDESNVRSYKKAAMYIMDKILELRSEAIEIMGGEDLATKEYEEKKALEKAEKEAKRAEKLLQEKEAE